MVAGAGSALARTGAALALALLAAGAGAQSWPTRPIRFVAPFAAGGGTDLVARRLAQKLTEALGQSVLVDNRAGASAVIGTEIVAKAPPDGYTIMIATPTFTVNPSMVRKLPYDSLRDFAPISLIATTPHLLAIHPSMPAKTVRELIALGKARPGQLTYSSGGNGASSHLSAELFSASAGIRMVHVPYRGTGQAVLAIVSGEVTLGFNDVMTNLPQMRAGRLRGIAVTSLSRSGAVPDLPTLAESGFPGYQSGVWYGILAPAGVPAEIVARLHRELVRIVRSPDFTQTLSAEGADVVAGTPEEFAEFIRREIPRWSAIIERAKISAN